MSGYIQALRRRFNGILSGAKGFWNLGWSLVTNEGLYRLSGCCLMVFESEWYYYY